MTNVPDLWHAAAGRRSGARERVLNPGAPALEPARPGGACPLGASSRAGHMPGVRDVTGRPATAAHTHPHALHRANDTYQEGDHERTDLVTRRHDDPQGEIGPRRGWAGCARRGRIPRRWGGTGPVVRKNKGNGLRCQPIRMVQATQEGASHHVEDECNARVIPIQTGATVPSWSFEQNLRQNHPEDRGRPFMGKENHR
jgi:hypothetical protein